MGLADISNRHRARSRGIAVAADLGLALVLVLVSLVLFKPSIAASLDVPFKLIVPLAAVLLVIRAVSKETP